MVSDRSSKAAMIILTVNLAKDLAPYNIRVNAVSPALVPGLPTSCHVMATRCLAL